MAAPKKECMAAPQLNCMIMSQAAPPKKGGIGGFFGSIGKGIKNMFSSNKQECAPKNDCAPRKESFSKKDSIRKCNFDSFDALEGEEIIINPKDIFSYMGIDGNWEYSNDLLDLFGINDSKLKLLNTLLKENFDKNVLITFIALAYIQANPAQFGAENKIMISKSKSWLKEITKATDMEIVNNHITSAKAII